MVQVALNCCCSAAWIVANIVIGARNEEELKQNLGAVAWRSLTAEQIVLTDKRILLAT